MDTGVHGGAWMMAAPTSVPDVGKVKFIYAMFGGKSPH